MAAPARGDHPAQERAPDEQIARELVAPGRRVAEEVAEEDLAEHAGEHAGERRDRQDVDGARGEGGEAHQGRARPSEARASVRRPRGGSRAAAVHP